MRKSFFIVFAIVSCSFCGMKAEDFNERSVPHTTDAGWSKQPKGLHASWASIDTATDKYRCPSVRQQRTLSLTGWRGERVCAKAIVWAADKDGEISLATDGKGCSAWLDCSTTGFVAYVMGDPVVERNCSSHPDLAANDSTLVADRITAATRTQYERQTVRPLWLTFDIPFHATKGQHSGSVKVKMDGCKTLTLKYTINVVDATMPRKEDRRFHLDLWQNPYAVARQSHVPLWSNAHFEAMRPLMTRLGAAGQCGITASITHRPWNGQTFDPFGSMITEMKKADGTWEYDFTVFDRWVEFMLSCGVGKYIYCYSVMPWQMSFRYYDQAANAMLDANMSPDSPEYEEYWTRKLRAFASHLKSKGWFENTVIAMDERPEEMMRIALRIVKAADEGFKLSLAGGYHDSLKDQLFDYCIAYNAQFPDGVAEARRQKGLFTTFYTCCAEERPNTFVSSPQEEGVALALISAERGLDGYLRWAFNSWTEDAAHDARFRTWTAGDAFIVYPDNQSSVRFEQLIRGIQMYEKIQAVSKDKSRKAAVRELLRPFSHANMPETDIAKSVAALEEYLNSEP